MFANIVLKNEAIQWQPVMKFIYFFQVSKNDIMSTLNSLRWQTHIRWIEKFNHVALYRDILKCLITIFDIFEFKIIPSLKLQKQKNDCCAHLLFINPVRKLTLIIKRKSQNTQDNIYLIQVILTWSIVKIYKDYKSQIYARHHDLCIPRHTVKYQQLTTQGPSIQ